MTARPIEVRPERPMAGRIRLASRMHALVPSAVREILKVTERPEVISFAGGLPAPELFPVQAIDEAFRTALARDGQSALQYGITEGHLPLREWIAARARSHGVAADADELLITTGAQQGIDLVAKVLLDPGDVVVVESPTYLAAVQTFAAYEARLVSVPGDDDGIELAGLERAFERHRPALLYLVPEFQNPKGSSLASARRPRVVELARRYGVPILEDDPYGELRFEGARRAPLIAHDSDGWVMRLGTFSKTLAPGLRIGWVHARGELMRRLVTAKQAADLHCGTLVQRAISALLEGFDYDGHLDSLRSMYRERRDAMEGALSRAMPEGTRWIHPEGGLFFWVELPAGVKDGDVFRSALEQGVAVVPGRGFFAHGEADRFIRLNFSNQSLARIETGVARLGAVVTRHVSATRP